MNRRSFLATGVSAVTAGLVPAGSGAVPRPAAAARPAGVQGATGRRFGLDYAPHFGMFRHHAGDDLVDQLRFMHDEGFRSLEDNTARGRSPAADPARSGCFAMSD